MNKPEQLQDCDVIVNREYLRTIKQQNAELVAALRSFVSQHDDCVTKAIENAYFAEAAMLFRRQADAARAVLAKVR